MKRTILAIALFSAYNLNAQNTFPTSGKVGVGTATPSEALDVNGTLIVDSSLIVKDSVRFQDRLTVDLDAKFKGESVFVGDAKAKSDLKILGETKMKGDAFVEGNFKFKGLQDPTVTDDRILTINPNGKTKVETRADLISSMYQLTPCFPFTDINGNQTTYPAPVWNSAGGASYGVIYTADPCPGRVGIGTSQPEGQLHVIGTGLFTSKIGIGTNTPEEELDINGNGQFSGTVSIGTPDIATGYHLSVNGKIMSEELTVQLKSTWPDYVFSNDYIPLSTKDIENSIKSDGKLPFLPSAKQVKEKGLDISETIKAQTELIENLTLLILEQNKRIEALEEKLNTAK